MEIKEALAKVDELLNTMTPDQGDIHLPISTVAKFARQTLKEQMEKSHKIVGGFLNLSDGSHIRIWCKEKMGETYTGGFELANGYSAQRFSAPRKDGKGNALPAPTYGIDEIHTAMILELIKER